MAQLHYWGNCDELLKRPHLLIAGATGSGKSVLINSIMYTLLTYQPNEKQVILIDPKRVELFAYKRVPHCIGYASEVPDMVAQLRQACEMMDRRYAKMQSEGKKLFEGADVYIVIDEIADLMLMTKEAEPLIQKLALLGRAARYHLIMATQNPSRKSLPAAIIQNIGDRLALHCNDKIESRQILGQPGAEILPRYGKCIYKSPEGMWLCEVPFTHEEKIAERINFWT